MGKINKLIHLEHLEDEMLNTGVEGCEKIVMDMVEIRKMLGCNGTGYLQTKWDGAPSIVAGELPGSRNKLFFVAKKDAFNTDPRLSFDEADIDTLYSAAKYSSLRPKMKYCLEYLSKINIKGVIQGDLIYTPGDLQEKVHNGKTYITFKPQLITYGVLKDSPLGKRIAKSKFGIVIHSRYNGDDIETMGVVAGAHGMYDTDHPDVFCVNNDTPYNEVGFDPAEEKAFDSEVLKIKKACAYCGKFLDDLVSFGGGVGNPSGDQKYHIAPYVKKYFNSEITGDTVTTTSSATLQGLVDFYNAKMEGYISKLKQEKTRSEKQKLVDDSILFLAHNEEKYKSMVDLYRMVQGLKKVVIDKLSNIEDGYKTFIFKDGALQVTAHEGYVLHRGTTMVKLVDRLEFSRNNAMMGGFG